MMKCWALLQFEWVKRFLAGQVSDAVHHWVNEGCGIVDDGGWEYTNQTWHPGTAINEEF